MAVVENVWIACEIWEEIFTMAEFISDIEEYLKVGVVELHMYSENVCYSVKWSGFDGDTCAGLRWLSSGIEE